MAITQNGGALVTASTAEEKLKRLNRIGIALSSTRDPDELLALIVTEARAFVGCDAGSLYLREDDRLRFVVSQNDTIRKRMGEKAERALFRPFTVPINRQSIAGYAAATGETLNLAGAYEIPADAGYALDRDFDKRNNYRTQSMLVVPMKDQNETVVGVLQLINALEGEGRIRAFSAEDEELVLSLASQGAVAVVNARLTKELKEAHYDTIVRLAVAAEYRDQDTAAHIQRVSHYARALAKAIGLDGDQQELVFLASPMHDVGKLGVPDAVLLKPGRLEPEERKVMEEHAVIGARILGGSQSRVLQAAEEIALSHQEKWDGSGYPNHLKGEEIPLFGRLVAVADVFDALTTKRPYKEPMGIGEAAGVLEKDAGTHFEPRLVEAFMGIIDEVVEIYSRYQ